MPGRLWNRFVYAFAGIKAGFLSEENIRIEIGCALFALTVSTVLGLSAFEMAFIVVLIAVVLSLEYFNTGLEWFVDQYQPERSPLAQFAKDSAAASVLIASIAAVLVSLSIWIPHLIFFLRFGFYSGPFMWLGLAGCFLAIAAYLLLIYLVPLQNKEHLTLKSQVLPLEES